MSVLDFFKLVSIIIVASAAVVFVNCCTNVSHDGFIRSPLGTESHPVMQEAHTQ